MTKSELLKQMGFSEEYIEKLNSFSEHSSKISPSDYSSGVIHHESSDSKELILQKGNEGDDNEFIVSM